MKSVGEVKIKSDCGKTHIYIDGNEIHGITELKLSQLAGEFPVLELRMLPKTISFEGNEIICNEK